MLKALYDYGIHNHLTLPPGLIKKQIRGYIVLSKDGEYLTVEKCENETQPCPDIGSLANGKDKCNVLAEKSSVILFAPEKEGDRSAKNEFFRKALADGAKEVPEFLLCLKVLENEQILSAIQAEANQRKIKGMDRISFKIDGQPIVLNPLVQHWWEQYRIQFTKSDDSNFARCIITGEPTVPLATVPTVNGLQLVGGHARGDALICFDKSAFCSYNLKQAANAPVSEEAFAVVKAALDDLLVGSPAMYKRDKDRKFNPTAPVFAGMKFVHWYDCQVEPTEDPISLVLNFKDFVDEEDDEDEEDEVLNPEKQEVLYEEEQKTKAQRAKRKADDLIKSIQNGGKRVALNCRYHILLLSGANGRVMVRRYENGNYADLQKNLIQWEDDLKMCNDIGTEMRPCKLTVRLIRLLSRQKNDKNSLERMKKELAGFAPSIVMAIMNGTQLPDEVAVKALATIRSEMLDPDENNKFSYMPNGICCQWLKVWLLRRKRMKNEEVKLMAYYDPEFANVAYHCGALVAVYADIQRAAMDVKTGIVQRYYASASRTPALVLGRLEVMSRYYFEKIKKNENYEKKEKESFVRSYEDRLNQIYTFFGKEKGHEMPKTLDLEQQSYFAIGYRQMCAQMNADKRARAAAKKEKEQSKTETMQEE